MQNIKVPSVTPPKLPTFPVGTPREIRDAFTSMQQTITDLQNHVVTLHQTLAAAPQPLTIAQINQGLSSGGAAPLNLTGLVGSPVITP